MATVENTKRARVNINVDREVRNVTLPTPCLFAILSCMLSMRILNTCGIAELHANIAAIKKSPHDMNT